MDAKHDKLRVSLRHQVLSWRQASAEPRLIAFRQNDRQWQTDDRTLVMAAEMVNPYQSPQSSTASDYSALLACATFPVREHVEITPDILTDAYLAQRGSVGPMSIRVVAGVVGSISLIVGVMILYDNIGRLPTRSVMVATAIVCGTATWLLIWALMGKRLSRWMLRWYYKSRRNELGPAVYEFTREGVSIENGGSGYQVSWSQISRWKEHDSVVIGFFEKQRYLIFPVRLFSTAGTDLICGMHG